MLRLSRAAAVAASDQLAAGRKNFR